MKSALALMALTLSLSGSAFAAEAVEYLRPSISGWAVREDALTPTDQVVIDDKAYGVLSLVLTQGSASNQASAYLTFWDAVPFKKGELASYDSISIGYFWDIPTLENSSVTQVSPNESTLELVLKGRLSNLPGAPTKPEYVKVTVRFVEGKIQLPITKRLIQ